MATHREKAVAAMVEAYETAEETIPAKFPKSRMLNVLNALVALGWKPPAKKLKWANSGPKRDFPMGA